MQLIREQSNASVQLSRTGGNVGKGTAGHADRTGLRQPEGQETQVFHEALLQGQRLHAEVPFDEQIKAKRLFCDAETHPGDAFFVERLLYSAPMSGFRTIFLRLPYAVLIIIVLTCKGSIGSASSFL